MYSVGNHLKCRLRLKSWSFEAIGVPDLFLHADLGFFEGFFVRP